MRRDRILANRFRAFHRLILVLPLTGAKKPSDTRRLPFWFDEEKSWFGSPTIERLLMLESDPARSCEAAPKLLTALRDRGQAVEGRSPPARRALQSRQIDVLDLGGGLLGPSPDCGSSCRTVCAEPQESRCDLASHANSRDLASRRPPPSL